MNPKDKANEIVGKFYHHFAPTELSRKYLTWENCKSLAYIAVDEIIKSLDNFGYTHTMYDSYYTGQIVFTDGENGEDPNKFWNEVKKEIETLN